MFVVQFVMPRLGHFCVCFSHAPAHLCGAVTLLRHSSPSLLLSLSLRAASLKGAFLRHAICVSWDFPGGPVVTRLCSGSAGGRLDSGWGTKIPLGRGTAKI